MSAISHQHILEILAGYDKDNITIGTLGGHSGLDVCHGAKKYGFKTVAVCQKGRDLTYSKYFKTRPDNDVVPGQLDAWKADKGCVDDVILVEKFGDIVKPEVQEQLRAMNTIFIHNRYFWVYCDFEKIENEFLVPILGTREMLRLEERDVPNNQYWMLEQAGIRIPKIFSYDEYLDVDNFPAEWLGRPMLVKVNEAQRKYERAFFVVDSPADYLDKSKVLLEEGKILEEDLKKAVIEEFVIGAHVNFNFFYSPLDGELEFMGTDMRRQTNLDGFLRMTADQQLEMFEKGMKPKMVENGHVAVTIKESLVEKAFEIGEKFVKFTGENNSPGIIGPFALQGAVVAEDGREEIVIFDVSMRIPGSPGTRSTPYSGYLYGDSLSYGERLAMEVKRAIKEDKLPLLVT